MTTENSPAAVNPTSILFLSIDSCRWDTFEATDAPNLKAIGPAHRAHAPGYFTYASHCAMFMGFTPGDASSSEPFVNPKRVKIFRMHGGGTKDSVEPFCTLEGDNVIDGLKRLGYKAYGSGAVDWFDDTKPTTQNLIRDFDDFLYAGNCWSLHKQLAWADERLAEAGDQPVFLFLNIGETHVPYYYEGAEWTSDGASNPCKPFADDNDADECRRRQALCLQFVDRELAPLLGRFADANVIACADHGDAWGEDGLWAHGFHHPKVLEVPLVYRLQNSPAKAGKKGLLGRMFGR
ncbi:MAG: hypothetical protein ACYTDX_03425 [Planctomycetota bacterium]